jgi:hypothetical protein
MRCQDIPRDGRGDLVCLLDERFPCFRRQDPSSRPPGPSRHRRRNAPDRRGTSTAPVRLPQVPARSMLCVLIESLLHRQM